MANIDSPSSSACQALSRLIEAGRLPWAEQSALKLMQRQNSAVQAELAVFMARAWSAAGDAARTCSWVTRLPADTGAALARDAAHLALEAGNAVLAHQWFNRAAVLGVLQDADRLEHARATLAAAERARLPHGRQGSWQRHLKLLKQAAELFAALATSEDEALREHAQQGAHRTQSLMGTGLRQPYPVAAARKAR